ncbi:hypothetical protein [Actinomadura meridiana]|uniref:hypothetical protein n=1 Tax=Actinomadura meridiana TaxID=559626 RepID=UPI0031F0DD01
MLRGRDGRRIPIQIHVEPVGDGLIAQTLTSADLENGPHHRAPHRVGSQHMLGGSLFPASGDRVRNLMRQVPVRRAPDVEALLGVGLEPAPGFLQHLQDVPLGHTLLHPPREHLRRTFPVQRDRLVGRPQRDTELLQRVLDLRADISPARDPVDRLTDHRIEPPIRLGRLQQQVLNAPVTRNRNVETLVPSPEPTSGKVLAPRLDVIEVRDDHPSSGKSGVQGALAVGELTR